MAGDSRNLPFMKIMRTACAGAVLLVLAACETTGGAAPETAAGPVMDGVERAMLESGREAETAKEYEKAAAIYGRLYERRHDDAAILSAFIRNMRYSGRAKEVTAYVERTSQHLMGDVAVNFEYAKALLSAGRKRESLDFLTKAKAAMPNNWQVLSAIGIAHDGLEEFTLAQNAYAAALRLAPGNPVVLNNLAMSLAMDGKLDEAIATLEQAAARNRTSPQIRQNLALLYAVNGDFDRARTLAAMDLDKNNLENNLSFYRRFEGMGQ